MPKVARSQVRSGTCGPPGWVEAIDSLDAVGPGALGGAASRDRPAEGVPGASDDDWSSTMTSAGSPGRDRSRTVTVGADQPDALPTIRRVRSIGAS